jgi:hypothetical protein
VLVVVEVELLVVVVLVVVEVEVELLVVVVLVLVELLVVVVDVEVLVLELVVVVLVELEVLELLDVLKLLEVEELLDLPHVIPGRWSPIAATMLRPSGPDEKWSTRPGDIDAVRDNRIGVQDEGSQLVALAVANVEVEGTQTHWLDMCAGPGGNAAILAGLASEAGADFTALEPIPARAHLVSN